MSPKEKKEINPIVGERVKKLRNSKNISQEVLANQIGFKNKSSINLIESGKRTIPFDKLNSIARALNTTPSYLLGWTNDANEDTSRYDDLVMTLGEPVDLSKTMSEEEILIYKIKDKLEIEEFTIDELKEVSNYIDFIISRRKL